METKVKEHPILFSGAMVRALLNGTKTQTRRIIKVQPDNEYYRISTLLSTTGDRRNEGRHFWGRYNAIGNSLLSRSEGYFPCPYGHPGDRLWVRETHTWYPGDEKEPAGWIYRADADGPTQMWVHFGPGWKPSLFMRREVSRLLLEITAIRCERLQDISEADAIAEGIQTLFSAQEIATTNPPLPFATPADSGWRNYLWHGNPELTTIKKAEWAHQYSSYTKPVDSYSSLWASINGAGSWEANPWVWVVEFKQIAA